MLSMILLSVCVEYARYPHHADCVVNKVASFDKDRRIRAANARLTSMMPEFKEE